MPRIPSQPPSRASLGKAGAGLGWHALPGRPETLRAVNSRAAQCAACTVTFHLGQSQNWAVARAERGYPGRVFLHDAEPFCQ